VHRADRRIDGGGLGTATGGAVVRRECT
jgi:hypothetical protein